MSDLLLTGSTSVDFEKMCDWTPTGIEVTLFLECPYVE
jgi:hypothetical protein